MVRTLTGDNSFMLQAELEGITREFIGEYGDLGLEHLDGDETSFADIQGALQSLPFLATKKMVVLRQASANKLFVEQVEPLLKDLPDSTILIIVESKIDKRSSFYKYLKKATDFREYGSLDRNGLARWLSQQAKEAGGSLHVQDALYLVERVGVDQRMLANELEKLLIYNSKVTREIIDLLTDKSPQSTVFELLEAAFAGKSRDVMRLYEEQRELKTEPQQIIAMLTWQLHILAIVKTAGERSADSIAQQAKINPFVVRKSISIARGISLQTLKDLIEKLLLIDIRLKREDINADDAVQNYLLAMTIQN